MLPFFPLRKIKRHVKYVLLGTVLVLVGLAVYMEYVDTITWYKVDDDHQRRAECAKSVIRDSVSTHHWSFKYIPQPWRSEYKGQANLHVFEDWCGTSIASLRKNPHYPLYPHSRLTVNKLAVSPSWKNYGLRIFGYIHPSISGEFLFAVASAENSEFWLSQDENPENLQLFAHVGKTGDEWTAPGEYGKFTGQISRPVMLKQNKRFYFEVIHKHGHEHTTDHVELAWRLNKAGTHFELIDSNSLSLYTAEASLKMNDVTHIPQTAASHEAPPLEKAQTAHHGSEMLRDDPRDTFFKVHLLDKSQLWSVLPKCSYKPSYTVKDRMIGRYQGLQYVYLSYVYPNDHTRLTHMEKSNMCFYQIKSYNFHMYDFSQYMRLDKVEEEDGDDTVGWEDFRAMEIAEQEDREFDYKDDLIMNRQRKLHFRSGNRKNLRRKRTHEGMNRLTMPHKNLTRNNDSVSEKENQYEVQNQNNMADVKQHKLQKQMMVEENQHKLKYQNKMAEENQHDVEKRNRTVEENRHDPQKIKKTTDENPHKLHYKNKMVEGQQQVGQKNKIPVHDKDGGDLVKRMKVGEKAPIQGQRSRAHVNNRLKDPPVNILLSSAKPREFHGVVHNSTHQGVYNDTTVAHISKSISKKGGAKKSKVDADLWEMYGDLDTDVWSRSKTVYDPEVRWDQTFQVGVLDFQVLRNDWIDLTCNVSGNLLISQSEVTLVVEGFMEKLEQTYPGRFSLQRIVNVVKRVDEAQGNRYLLELDLMEKSRVRVRLVHYVYVLKTFSFSRSKQNTELLLCNPQTFLWNPDATIHIIVPVKNQARWVQQFIADMEELHQATGENNVNIIIADYSSTDMDVEQALQKSRLPRFQYLRQAGNFERSAGLQAGIDLITDDHSIVFLCDLHLHFPLGFFDSVRKHCVEGHMVFAPIVMRLNCGATPQEPDGYWEVNGFGLLGIYKSDLDTVGGMNTREFTDHWGGEDWELLDRIVEAGLEVERLYLRNFFHYHHTRRGMWNSKTVSRT